MAFSDLCAANGKLCVGCCIKHHQVFRKNLNAQLRLSTEKAKKLGAAAFGAAHTPTSQTNGLCWALVEKKGAVCCAIHPLVNKGKDHRPDYPHCYKKYFCPTSKYFKRWSQKKKADFVEFLKSKKDLEWYTYSKGMDDGTWSREFKAQR